MARLTDEERADRAMTEAKLRGRVLYRAKKHGWRVVSIQRAMIGQWQTPTVKGFPDLMLVKNGENIIFAELKRELKEPTPEQWEWLNLLESAGCTVAVWRPSDLRKGIVEKTLALMV